MPRIDDLPPDQRAALQLLLQQGRSYDEIARLLRIEPAAVAERARAALDALGPEDVPGLTLERQDEVADYLLGQQSASQRAATREFLAGSGAGRAWARTVASELRGSGVVAAEGLPEIPAEGEEVHEAFEALGARTQHRERVARSSRIGGLILLVGVGIALAIIVALILGGDDGETPSGAELGEAQTQTQTQQQAGDQPEVLAQVNLNPPQGTESRAAGAAIVSRVNGQPALAVTAQNVPATTSRNAYAVFLDGCRGGEPRRLGFTPPVSGSGGQRGRLQGFTVLPEDFERCNRVVVSRESSNSPARPTNPVLQGTLQLGQGAGGQGAGGQGEGR